MAVYEYECKQCKEKTEQFEAMSAPRLRVCPRCRGELSQLLFPSVLFMGKMPFSGHRKWSLPNSDSKKP